MCSKYINQNQDFVDFDQFIGFMEWQPARAEIGVSHSTTPKPSPISTQNVSNTPAIKRKSETQEPITSKATLNSNTPLDSQPAKKRSKELILNSDEVLEPKQETIARNWEDGDLWNSEPSQVHMQKTLECEYWIEAFYDDTKEIGDIRDYDRFSDLLFKIINRKD